MRVLLALLRSGRPKAFYPALLLVLAGCRGPQSMLDQAGPEAASVVKLWWILFGVGSLVLLAITILLLMGCFRTRSPHARPPSDRRLGRGLLIGGVASTVLLLVVLVATHTYSQPFADKRDGALTIEVTGKRWWWAITYAEETGKPLFRTANEIHIPVGVPVRLRLSSDDVIHSFWVPKLAGKVDLIKGRTNYLWIQADEAGVYRGQCAEFCGMQHAKMGFMVIAQAPGEFQEWLFAQAAPAEDPPNELAARGRDVFKRSDCVDCHTIRGVSSTASVGPDLTHLGSRRTLAAGALPNRKGQLAGWLADPQSIKPGNLMPSVPLPAEDFRALLHYLEELN